MTALILHWRSRLTAFTWVSKIYPRWWHGKYSVLMPLLVFLHTTRNRPKRVCHSQLTTLLPAQSSGLIANKIPTRYWDWRDYATSVEWSTTFRWSLLAALRSNRHLRYSKLGPTASH